MLRLGSPTAIGNGGHRSPARNAGGTLDLNGYTVAGKTWTPGATAAAGRWPARLINSNTATPATFGDGTPASNIYITLRLRRGNISSAGPAR